MTTRNRIMLNLSDDDLVKLNAAVVAKASQATCDKLSPSEKIFFLLGLPLPEKGRPKKQAK